MKETRERQRINKSALKDRRVANGQRLIITDTEIRGFRVVVGERSTSFILEKRIKGVTRSTTKLTIGSFPAMSVEEARRTALAWSVACDRGEDPRPNKPTKKRTLVKDGFGVEQVEDITLRKAFEIHVHYARLKQTTIKGYRCFFRKYLQKEANWTFERLSEHYVRTKGQDLVEHASIGIAQRVLLLLSAVWNSAKAYAEARKFSFPGNVVALIKPKSLYSWEPERKVVPLKDLGRFICFLESIKSREDLTRHTRLTSDIYLVMLFLGMRIREALTLKWEYLDLEHGYYIIPGSQLKNGMTHYKPISPYPLEILRAQRMRQEIGNDYVFVSLETRQPAHRGKHVTEGSPINKVILQETGIDVNSHGMRRTYLSLADNLGIPRKARKDLVNHVSTDVTDGYSVQAFNPKRGLRYQTKIEDAFLEIKRRHLNGIRLPYTLTELVTEISTGTRLDVLEQENARLREELAALKGV